MAETTSWAFPQIFDTARNRVGLLADEASVVNRTRLLILTEPTEMYNSPDVGVGLRRYLWHYNTDNTRAMIQDRMIAQFDKYEPCVDANKTQFSPGLLTEADDPSAMQFNKITMTVILYPVFGGTASLTLDEGLPTKRLTDE